MSLAPSLPSSASQGLFTDLFRLPRVRSKYLDAPLREERTNYILYLLKHRVPLTRVKSTALMQVHAVKHLNMTEPRPIMIGEVQAASSKWANKSTLRMEKRSNSAVYQFTQTVTNWLRFSGLFIEPPPSKDPFDFLVKPHLEDLRFHGCSEATIYNRGRLISTFLGWLGERVKDFADVSLVDIDNFLDDRRAKGWRQSTIRNTCGAVRVFFRFCESQGWCKAGIAKGILTPRPITSSMGPRGPAWKDVRRMLGVIATTPAEYRENAILSLCAIYALRRSEIVQLNLKDLDWDNEIMTVQRAKRGGIQRFPIQHEVGETILAYLRWARPKSSCRSLFTTIQAPIRPMKPNSVGVIVAKRMRRLGVQSRNFGPHALRHSCATQLLNKGFSLEQIADFLGHRGLETVSVYARYNPRLLRRVASFSLAGIR